MPCSYRILPAFGLIWNQLHGELTRTEISDLSARLRLDRAFDPDFLIIQDLRRHTSDPLGFLDMVRITDDITNFRKTLAKPLRMGAIAPGDAAFGMSRMLQSLLEARLEAQIVVGRTSDEVSDGLHLPEKCAAILRTDPEPDGN